MFWYMYVAHAINTIPVFHIICLNIHVYVFHDNYLTIAVNSCYTCIHDKTSTSNSRSPM